MLNPQVAQERLKEFATDNPRQKQQERIAALPQPAQAAALALLGLKPDGTPFVTEQGWEKWAMRNKQQALLDKAQKAAFTLLNNLPETERETFFAAFFPRLASLLTWWWTRDELTLYQPGYNRRPFRLQRNSTQEAWAQRQTLLKNLVVDASTYQEMSIDWFAAWVPYIEAYNTDSWGRLLAQAVDRGGPEGDAVFEILLESGRGDHAVGAMGRHVTRGLLTASRPDGWEFIEKLLLAAQRQEGLRQSVLEVIDEAHPEAFRRMLALIRENELFRFSATIRAADVWLGMNWNAYEKLSVKQANAAVELIETFLSDKAKRDDAITSATDGQTVYLALWSTAFEDAHAALRAAAPLLSDPNVVRRYAALHLIIELRLNEAKPLILNAFDDEDLRVAQKAFGAGLWYGDSESLGSTEALTALLQGHEVAVVDALESRVESGTGLAGALNRIKDSISSLIADLASTKIKDPKAGEDDDDEEEAPSADTDTDPATRDADDRFERLERNLPRFPEKAKALEPVIWEWDVLTAHAEPLADALTRVMDDRSTERLLPYVPQMSQYGRSKVAESISKEKNKTALMRETLFTMAADPASYVRDSAFKAIQDFTLADTEAERIESLLTRKAADVRKSALSLLLKRDDPKVLESGERLTGAKDVNQRVAGLDLLTQMVDKKRSPDKARAIVSGFAETRGAKLTDAESAMVHPLLDATREKPTLENALGLMDPSKRAEIPELSAPQTVPQFVSLSVLEILQALDALVEQHREAPVATENYAGTGDEMLLGNAEWRFPMPKADTPWEEDAARWPLREVWENFWDTRPDSLRDADGLELLRTSVLTNTPGFVHSLLHVKDVPDAVKEQLTPFYEQRKKLIIKHKSVVQRLIYWLLRRDEASIYTANLTEFLLDAAQASLFYFFHSTATRTEENHDWRDDERTRLWLTQARNHRKAHPDLWTPEQSARLLNLIFWLEKRKQISVADMEERALAYRQNLVNDHDVYYVLLGARLQSGSYSSNSFSELNQLSTRKDSPLFETTPGLKQIVDNCRKRIIEVELQRGDTETEASNPARSLRYSGGMETLLKLVAALGKDSFARGYSYYGQTNRSNVFSNLIRITFPGEADTPEAFAKAAKAAKITDKRLIETAMYAPQWARHVEYTLGWNDFTQAVWWMHAHTKDNSWSVEKEIKETWTAEIADKTPLSSEDLTEGAVDVQWFKRVHEALGEEHWKQVDDAAKFASSAGGHKRAQLFADAMLGRVDLADLIARIQEKRHQDSVRALGLIPLPRQKDASEADLLARYKVMQEMLRTCKQFGAQRQESEKLSVRIGMENLARTAGYPDPIRLTWAMEASAVADLKDGAVTHTVGDVSVSLSINGLGLPELAVVKKGKPLANIPPAVKKDTDVAELVARKTDLTRQVSRMRESLEGASCRGDKFTGAEIAQLLEHPILRPLLQNLVFIEAEGKEPIIGYPTSGKELEDCDGKTVSISAKTELRIAHPYDLLHTDKWDRWQKDCFLRERVQPFKQVFRELYVLTDAEKKDNNRSQRYAGHQVNPKQALALFNKRGWIGGGEYDYDSEGPRKTFHEDGYTVAVGFMGTTLTPADVEGSTIETVHFTRKGEWKPVALETVPPRVFSEAMRDLDLVVSVAHVGGVDPEASQSTVEMRSALLREALALLKIDNVRLEKSHAIVAGALATYNVHLGSAVVHRQPGGYLCIVPVHSQHRGRLFLPFADDDPRTAEVISKVILLAKDGEIKDPTILEQILSTR